VRVPETRFAVDYAAILYSWMSPPRRVMDLVGVTVDSEDALDVGDDAVHHVPSTVAA